MEVAIPVITLGALYVISNQKKRENFETQNSKIEDQLPNTHVPPINYPTTTNLSLPTNINYYPHPNTATDRYFQQDAYQKMVREEDSPPSIKFTSLTGNSVDPTTIEHNNMVPFFGSHVKQRTVNFDGNEGLLDSLQGAGSQQISKEAIAPLFKPQKNMGWAYGTPIATDFLQSRVNPGRNMSNVKPFETQNVGPGLARGYTTAGSGGFNSGMEARAKWIPKTVDELRIKTNPKITFGGVTLGAKRAVQNRGIEGKVEKYTPDTFYINSPERYFTTPTQEKGPTARSEEIFRPENRPETTREYFGTGELENKGPYIPGKYQQPHRPTLKADVEYPGPANAAGHWKSCSGSPPCRYGKEGYNAPMNERTLANAKGGRFLGVAGSVIGAVIAPIMDVLRPSRKENVIGNLRPTGNMDGPNQMYVYNPAEGTRTTTKETTEKNPYPLYINNQIPGGGYQSSPQQPTEQQRDSTNCSYIGDAGNTAGTSNAPVYNAEYNAHLNSNRSSLSTAPRGNAPAMGNMELFQGNQNIQVKKLDQDRLNNAIMPGVRGTGRSSEAQIYGTISGRPSLKQGINCERTQPDILNAFRCNPYTQSLSSSA